MRFQFHIISADDHVQEPPTLWTERLSRKRWGDRVPRIARQADGTERWVIDSQVKSDRRLATTGALSKERFYEAQTWSQVPKACFDPQGRLKAMDQDGVDVQVLYPSAAGIGGEILAAIRDPELELACVQAYNDWILEIWGHASHRFVPQCLIPLFSVEAARKELERSVGRGHRGVVMPAFPWHLRPDVPHIHDRRWDPLWASAQELGVPICWHSGTDPRSLLEVPPGFHASTARAFESARRPVSNAVAVSSFLFSGIPERFPRLKVVFASSAIGWLTFQLENCDHEWHKSMMLKDGMDAKPTEIFHRQCYATTWFDRVGMLLRSYIGVDNILWQSEFPMETSTWPQSAELIRRNFEGVPAEDRHKVLFSNAAALYSIPH